jgi:hypothetical protein
MSFRFAAATRVHRTCGTTSPVEPKVWLAELAAKARDGRHGMAILVDPFGTGRAGEPNGSFRRLSPHAGLR